MMAASDECRRAGAVDVYVVQVVLDLEGQVDAGRLRRAAGLLSGRHPHLSCGFSRSGGQWTWSGSAVHWPWREADLSDRPVDRLREADFAGLLDADRTAGFDLAEPPLLRLALVKLAEDSHRWSAPSRVPRPGWGLVPEVPAGVSRRPSPSWRWHPRRPSGA
ncbi:condensation domain-containing protein [Streptomyces sp. NPDC020858]|uniref:condensation domain-containing protein n=1 Tax=Streptomyces sp. NPDC020858 TaxID=3365097 RepID=UPI00378DFE78